VSRTSRLFMLLDALRGHRRPVTATRLAEALSVSLRTIYRDIGTLVELGAPIDGEAGIGYVLRAGFFLPPLMFTEDELEALVLGARWVERQGDAGLARAAGTALATPLMTIATAKLPVTQFKHLNSWLARIEARESWQRTASPAPGVAAA